MSEKWYLSREGERYGPFSWEEITHYGQTGNIEPGDLAWRESTGKWVVVNQIPELTGLFSSRNKDTQDMAKKKKSPLTFALAGVAVIIIAAAVLVIPRIANLTSSTGGSSPGDYAPVSEDGTYLFGIDPDFYFRSAKQLEADEQSDFGSQTNIINADNPGFEYNGVGLEMSPLYLAESEANLKVTKMSAPEPVPDAKVNAYSFSLEGAPQDSGLYTLSIPYEPTDGTVGAGYFNENTNSWEPVVFELDEANNRIIITTNHLSTYGSFTISGEGTRYTRIAPGLFEAHDQFIKYGDMHAEVIEELINNQLTTGGKAWNLGKSVTDDWLKASGAIFEMEGLAYSSEFISGLSDAMTNVGTALAVAQLAVDYSRGDQRAMAVNTFNTAQGLAISKWGTKALKVSMIGVTAIDYSLTKLREQLIKGRQEVWSKAYELYYRENHARSGADWYRRIKDIHDYADSPEQFRRMLENDLNRYTYLFWQDETSQAIYQLEAQGHGFTGGGGLNEKLKDDIANAYKSQLLNETLEPVFRQLEKKVRYEQEEEYKRELNRLRAKFNQVVNLNIQEAAAEGEDLIYPGYIVQFGPLTEDADPRMWTGRLDENGHVRASFTVLGHLSAGAPNEIRLYKNAADMRDDKPAEIVEFTVSVPDTVITIGAVEEDLSGSWKGFMVIEYWALQDYDPSDPEVSDQVEGCENEFGETMWEVIKQTVEEHLIDVDIPITMGLDRIGESNLYNSTLDIHVDQVLPEDMSASSDRREFTAEFESGVLSFTLVDEDDGSVTYFKGNLEGGNNISGSFALPTNNIDFMSGSWRIERVEPLSE